jgi:DnaJ domain
MELDHDSGRMDGDILQGAFKGRALSSLSHQEMIAFYGFCRNATDQSLALYEAWLDRAQPEWRQAWGGAGASSARPQTGAMSKEEAYAVLGLKPGATQDEVRAAHKRLMKDFHPDRGGSDYLAAKINAAKDVLLQ